MIDAVGHLRAKSICAGHSERTACSRARATKKILDECAENIDEIFLAARDHILFTDSVMSRAVS